MKPASFPARKLGRQMDALSRFNSRLAAVTKAGLKQPGAGKVAAHDQRAKVNPRNAELRLKELAALTAQCQMSEDQARGIRSKKDRTSRAKLGRN